MTAIVVVVIVDDDDDDGQNNHILTDISVEQSIVIYFFHGICNYY